MRIRSVLLDSWNGFNEVKVALFEAKDSCHNPVAQQVSLIYAPNGSGKTTLGRRLKNQIPAGSGAFWFDDSADSVPFTESSEESRVFVFNEDFIDQKVRVREGNKGLNAVVLFDSQIIDEDRLNKVNLELTDSELRLNKAELRQKEIGETGESGKLLPNAIAAFKKELQKDGGWAQNVQQVKGLARKEQVVQAVLETYDAKYKDKIHSDTDETVNINSLTKKLAELTQNLRGTKNAKRIRGEFLEYQFPKAARQLSDLLQQVPKLKSVDDTSEIYTAQLDSEVGRIAHQLAEKIFLGNRPECCPVCTQSISNDLHSRLKAALENLRQDDAVKALQEEINGIPEFAQPDLTPPENIENLPEWETQKSTLQTHIEAIQIELESLRRIKTKKLESLNEPIKFNLSDLENSVNELKKAIETINTAIKEFNASVDSRELKIEEGIDVCYQLALHDADTVAAYKLMSELKEEELVLQSTINELSERIEEKTEEKQQLLSASAKTGIAAELINSYLEAIFAESNRLSLKPVEGAYEVYSRDKRLSAAALSTGERNILALAYFFASVFDQSEDYRNYAEQRLIVLDDPLSSFDSDNKFGVFTFLRQIIRNFIANQKTQVVILSHDVGLIRDFAAVLRTINGIKPVVNYLKNEELVPLQLDDFAEYRAILEKTYRYALMEGGDANSAPGPTGNELRLMLESFATFELGCGISELLQKKLVKDKLENSSRALQTYFEGPLYKLVLHGESHSEGAINSGVLELTSAIAPSERKVLCRDLICLIDAISSVHVPSRLGLSSKRNASLGTISDYLDNLMNWSVTAENRALPII